MFELFSTRPVTTIGQGGCGTVMSKQSSRTDLDFPDSSPTEINHDTGVQQGMVNRLSHSVNGTTPVGFILEDLSSHMHRARLAPANLRPVWHRRDIWLSIKDGAYTHACAGYCYTVPNHGR